MAVGILLNTPSMDATGAAARTRFAALETSTGE